MLAEFLAEQLFGRWALVLHYDLGRGLRAFAGRNEARLKEMVALANRRVGDLSALTNDPAATFAILDRFVRANIMAGDGGSPQRRGDPRPGVVSVSRRASPAASTSRRRRSS